MEKRRASWWSIVAAAFLSCWIAQPAAAQQTSPHWAYQTPQRPPLPAISTLHLAREPVDLFILSELARQNLQPSAEADRPTLLRRATLVLHGLIPTLNELQTLAANRSPDAYEQELDRLLASPAYGQRMASDWLDLARYADTHGFHADTEREQWRWRDWVIEQLNSGQPFDQFTIEQLAGDLLPRPTLSQQIATGYLRNHMLTDENGAIPEEWQTEIVLDRLQTIGTAWLGQTLACARCHDHKYDPLTQREYYGLAAIFNNLREPPLLVKGAARIDPQLAAPTREQQAALARADAAIAAAAKALEQRKQSSAADQRRWEQQAQAGPLAEVPADAATHLPLDAARDGRTADLARLTPTSRIIAKTPTDVQFSTGKFNGALLGAGSTYVELENWPALRSSASWTLSLWLFPTTRDDASLVAQTDEALYHRGIEWSLVDGSLQVRLTQRRESEEWLVRASEPLALSRWQHLAVTFDPRGEDGKPLLRLWRNGQELKTEITGRIPAAEVSATSPLRIGGRDAESGFRGLLDEVRLYARALSPTEISMLAGGNPLGGILRIVAERRSPEQRDLVQRYFLEHHDAEYQELVQALTREGSRRDQLQRQVPTVLAAEELPQPRETFVLTNGHYDHRGQRVLPQVPTFLAQQGSFGRHDRLGFAQWLVDPRHPLTGRVGVNRAWAQVFGTGLVATPEDFGIRAAKPSHPALLDWLAREFVDRGWDTKRLHRQLLSSATFRQRSDVSAALATADPANRWLARGPRVRLPAEQIRDVALEAAGLLNSAHGGRGVNPYQPGDLWKELAFDPATLSAQSYAASNGGELYRRSVYLFWKRTAPPVNLTALDAPSRETCVALRTRTNTPQQALVLLNDPTFVEAARELAVRVLSVPKLSTEQRLNLLLMRVLSREATAEERAALHEQLAADLDHFARHPEEAKQLLQVGQCPPPLSLLRTELAAWANLATVVLNLDETVTNH